MNKIMEAINGLTNQFQNGCSDVNRRFDELEDSMKGNSELLAKLRKEVSKDRRN